MCFFNNLKNHNKIHLGIKYRLLNNLIKNHFLRKYIAHELLILLKLDIFELISDE